MHTLQESSRSHKAYIGLAEQTVGNLPAYASVPFEGRRYALEASRITGAGQALSYTLADNHFFDDAAAQSSDELDFVSESYHPRKKLRYKQKPKALLHYRNLQHPAKRF